MSSFQSTGQTEFEDRRPVGALAQQRALEEIVEKVDDAGRGNRHWYREEEREGRQQDRPEAEAGIERECRGQRRHDGDCDYVHGKAYGRLFVMSASGTEVDQLRSFSIQSIRMSDYGWVAALEDCQYQWPLHPAC